MGKEEGFGKFDRLTVIGPGMIGASFSRALKARGLITHVTGCSRNVETLKSSLKSGYIDSFVTDPAEACKDSDLVLLSTPVDTFIPLVKAIAGSLSRGAILIDAGSVKGELVAEIDSLMPDGVHYVPCHPIAGSEMSGPDASSADLFVDACSIVTSVDNTDKASIKRIKTLWESIGAHVETLDPVYHDKVYALVSHFPHLVMYSMVNAVADMDPSALRFTGAGFDDSTRIAKSSPSLWRNICMLNKSNLADCITVLVDGLEEIKDALLRGDGEFLETAFARAQKQRLSIKGGR